MVDTLFEIRYNNNTRNSLIGSICELIKRGARRLLHEKGVAQRRPEYGWNAKLDSLFGNNA